jgi:hypothetical protein
VNQEQAPNDDDKAADPKPFQSLATIATTSAVPAEIVVTVAAQSNTGNPAVNFVNADAVMVQEVP